MARIGVSYHDVATVAAKLKEQGSNPTVEQVRQQLKTGSNSTISRHLRNWRENHEPQLELEVGIPAPLLAAVKGLHEALTEQANSRIIDIEKATQEKLADFEKKYLELKAANNTLITEKQAIQSNYEKLQEQHDIQVATISKLNQISMTKENDITLLQTRLSDKQDEIERLSKQYQHAQDSLEHFREATRQQHHQDKQAYEAKIAKLENKLIDNNTHIASLTNQVSSSKARTNELKSDQINLQKQLEQISANLNKLELSHQTVLHKNDELKKQNTDVLNLKTSLTQENKSYKEQNHLLMLDIAKKEYEISSLDNSQKKLEDIINTLRQDILHLTQDNTRLLTNMKLLKETTD